MWTYNNTSELYHHGILGMKWGHHSSRSSQSKQIHSNNYKKQKELRKQITKSVQIGSSVAVGLLAGNIGATAVVRLTGSTNAAALVAPSMAVIGGMKYYEWLTK